MKNKPKPTEDMKWPEAMDFLMRLVNISNLGALREGDLLNLIDDFRRYAEVEPDSEMASQLERIRREPRILQETIKKVRRIVDAKIDRQRLDLGELKLRLIFDGTRVGDDDRGAVKWMGPLKDVMSEFAANDLEDAEPWQVCRCKEPGPDCGKFFLAARKGQQYCSHACANKSASRAYREANATKRAANEKARYWKNKTSGADNKEQDSVDGAKTRTK
jgi:hypothetical protein